MERRTFVKGAVAGTVATTLTTTVSPVSADFDALPVGKDGFLVFIADGIYDPVDEAINGPTGVDFDRDVMGRTAEESSAHETAALDFFASEYDVSFAAGQTADVALVPGFPPSTVPVDDEGRIARVHTQLSPKANYRAVMVGGDNTKPEGFTVHDANHAAIVLADTQLKGAWGGAGRDVAAGSVLVFGEYLIETRKARPGDKGLSGYRISWTSYDPVTFLPGFAWPENRFLFDCRMYSDDFGTGVAMGRNETRSLGDGTVQQLIRNVITFPAETFYANR